MTEKPICGATKKNGEPCRRPAGWGTDHVGDGTCKLHGGSTPDAILKAAKAKATVMGIAIDVEPHEALLQCVRLTAGEVVYCNQMIAELAPEDAVGHPLEIVSREGYTSEEGHVSYEERREKVPMMNIWIRTRAQALERLAKFAKMALDAGVDERRVRLAEGFTSVLAPALRDFMDALELTEEQKKRAPKLLKAALNQIEGEQMSSELKDSPIAA